MKALLTAYHEGETIFSEGKAGRFLYLIKEGTVETSTLNQGKRVVLEALGAGDVIGEAAVFTGERYNMTATAKTFSRVYAIAQNEVEMELGATPKFITKLVKAMIKKQDYLNTRVLCSTNLNNPLVTFSSVLLLMASVRACQAVNPEGLSQVELPYESTLVQISQTTGVGLAQARYLLSELEKVNLVRIVDQSRTKRIFIRSKDIVEDAKRVEEHMGDKIQAAMLSDFELLDINELEELTEVSKAKILRTLSIGEIAEDVYLFRKTNAQALLKQAGKGAFQRVNIKSADDIHDASDIQFLAKDIRVAAIQNLEPYEQAIIIKSSTDEVASMLLGLFSTRVRAMISETVGMLGDLSEDDVDSVKEKLVGQLKAAYNEFYKK